ncbi:hypothetical protein VFSR5_0177 [Aliivibrio fischeri SR5]|uniref:Uncharacterized protein n=1 Tax=Aliivibrio fischeri SR5 TaxID=1088719 RepID=A0AAV3EXI8_ALIFS|nr:hypothetical protein VFSR5_0177 [Aliivibrio fischeri SR5]
MLGLKLLIKVLDFSNAQNTSIGDLDMLNSTTLIDLFLGNTLDWPVKDISNTS